MNGSGGLCYAHSFWAVPLKHLVLDSVRSRHYSPSSNKEAVAHVFALGSMCLRCAIHLRGSWLVGRCLQAQGHECHWLQPERPSWDLKRLVVRCFKRCKVSSAGYGLLPPSPDWIAIRKRLIVESCSCILTRWPHHSGSDHAAKSSIKPGLVLHIIRANRGQLKRADMSLCS